MGLVNVEKEGKQVLADREKRCYFILIELHGQVRGI
jgi:hypothetical protein